MSALAAGGGTAAYMGSKHKKVAKLQDQIYQLQVQLSESQEREKKLLEQINRIQKEYANNLFK